MKITAISDLHGYLPNLDKGDALCICGDIVPLKIQRDVEESKRWLETTFMDWANMLNFNYILIIPGNHDFVFEKYNDIFLDNEKIKYLCDSLIELNGIKFYGFPWCPDLLKWAFYADDTDMECKCNNIPNADILLTHCPPKVGDQGVVLDYLSYNFLSNYGNEFLTKALTKLNYKWVLSGHIHSGNHNIDKLNNTNCVNVSYLGETYKVSYNPFTFEI